jgi:hypothetical protein
MMIAYEMQTLMEDNGGTLTGIVIEEPLTNGDPTVLIDTSDINDITKVRLKQY